MPFLKKRHTTRPERRYLFNTLSASAWAESVESCTGNSRRLTDGFSGVFHDVLRSYFSILPSTKEELKMEWMLIFVRDLPGWGWEFSLRQFCITFSPAANLPQAGWVEAPSGAELGVPC